MTKKGSVRRSPPGLSFPTRINRLKPIISHVKYFFVGLFSANVKWAHRLCAHSFSRRTIDKWYVASIWCHCIRLYGKYKIWGEREKKSWVFLRRSTKGVIVYGIVCQYIYFPYFSVGWYLSMRWMCRKYASHYYSSIQHTRTLLVFCRRQIIIYTHSICGSWELRLRSDSNDFPSMASILMCDVEI